MKVLYFAEIKDLLAKQVEEIPLDNTLTVEQLKLNLLEQYPVLKNKTYQIAVNEEFVKDDDIVQQNDTVALIPPVSGG
ncbi:molybdopterin converting factor subunit 1 [Staphylococcus durrellii]|uniref:molybdopterin converting factor subunit 1 n=1 Tax=Staphylococcus durrellii TaxID=2781773 RepID=UPI00189E1A4F|nr:molybdopterin converting factor subunit 1 [Staphylococcus durrellii]MBF7016442.1 molybdopterin converting factor subunit 1 [Staphylococcus durrellii]